MLLIGCLWGSLVVLVFFSWWVVRCWGGLLPAGRNVRVSMMVECFGRFMFFFECVLVLGIYVLVLTSVLVLVCSVLLSCFPGGVLVVIVRWLVFLTLRSLVGGVVALLHCFTVFTVRGWLFLLYQLSFAVLILSSLL